MELPSQRPAQVYPATFPGSNIELSAMRKPSDASSFHAYQPQQRSQPKFKWYWGCQLAGSPYPEGHSPNRRVYIAARVADVILSTVLVVLATVALTAIPRGLWASAVLSPAISSLFASGFELWAILRRASRSHHFRRLLYDAALGIGYSIASGFLVSFTSGDISRSNPKSTTASAWLGMAILLLMLTEV